MIRAVLFDLDGTLLDLDLERFLRNYFEALAVATREYAGERTEHFIEAIRESTRAMMTSHPDITNESVFTTEFARLTGTAFADVWPVYERFYGEDFSALGAGTKPAEGARHVVETALTLGLRVAIATNPIFPRVAVDHRLAWAGLADLELPVVTTYEMMFACKPLPAYYDQVAGLLDVDPHDCIMVGDDRYLDMPAADVGMRTFYVGDHDDVVTDYHGTLTDLALLLPRLAATPDVF